MLNLYDFLQSQSREYKKLSVKDLLVVHYRCPQQERYVSFYTHLNYFVYVMEGNKTFFHRDKSYPLNEGTCAFVRKGGFMQERFFDSDWVVMAFFVPDSLLIARSPQFSISPFRQGSSPPRRCITRSAGCVSPASWRRRSLRRRYATVTSSCRPAII